MANDPAQHKTPRGIVARIAAIREAANLLIEKELRERGLTGIVPAHGAVLFYLFRQQGPVPMKELVQQAGRVKSTLSGMVGTLERHGYLYRQGSDSDARSVLIGLTDKGWGIKDHFQAISTLLEERVFGAMPEDDRERLMDMLAVVERNLAGE